MNNIYYVDGKFVPADQAMIPVDDLAIVRGIGVFDLLRTHKGKPFFLKEHVERLHHSAKEIDLAMPWSRQEVCKVVMDTLDRNSHQEEANVRIIVTGGSSPDFMTPKGRPRLLVLVTPLPKLPDWWHSRGVKVITLKVKRNFPGAKSIDYLPAAIALRKARREDAVEAIYLDDDGHALEGTTSNLFVFLGGKLVTPGSGILSGITRKVVMALAKEHYAIEVRDLSIEELLAANEVFITGTNKGLVPVVQVDRTTIGNGRPGPKTARMMTLLENYNAPAI